MAQDGGGMVERLKFAELRLAFCKKVVSMVPGLSSAQKTLIQTGCAR